MRCLPINPITTPVSPLGVNLEQRVTHLDKSKYQKQLKEKAQKLKEGKGSSDLHWRKHTKIHDTYRIKPVIAKAFKKNEQGKRNERRAGVFQ